MAVALTPQYTERSCAWTAWKVVFAAKQSAHQYDDDGEIYKIWFYDGPEVHVCSIWKGVVPETVTPFYSQQQNDADKADFEANYKTTANTRITSVTDGKQQVLIENVQLPVIEKIGTTASVTSVSQSNTSVTLLAANANRVGAILMNIASHTLYVKFGTGASSSSFTVQLSKDSYYEVPFKYAGIITGCWSSNGNSSVLITEIT
jgi:hypothetical protein